eukprot:Anaeramoba_flamelloidesa92340_13.p2 GENE.a92340_13~~a92340_13.p2  ORF type:complete len:124 (-),score=14.01 a92340_13:76-447(-)
MMKKIVFLAVFLMLFSGSAFAWTSTSDNGNIDCADVFTIGLSPNVEAGYTVADNTGVNDFFVIGTYHTQGDEVFATAQTLTKVWTASAEDTGSTMVDLFATIPQTAADAASDDLWSEDGWSAQ